MHTPSPEATMYFGGRRGRTMWRTLHEDDLAGICYLYPSGTFSCTADDQCPLFDNFYGGDYQRTRCNGGSCVVGGSGVYGDDCFDAPGCQSGTCLKGLDAAPGMDPGFCTQSCGSCPDGDLCKGGLCYLGYDDCETDADCTALYGSNWFCPMDLDGRFRCLKLCLTTATHCTGQPELSGTVCHHNEGGSPGFCRVPGAGASNDACEDGYDCASLFCAGLGVQPVCVGTPIVPPDDGSPIDGAPPPDGGGPGDSAVPGDSASPGDPGGDPIAGDPVDFGDGGSTADADEGVVTGGCACSSERGRSLLWFVPLLAIWRRR
jgi:hypothetical protein